MNAPHSYTHHAPRFDPWALAEAWGVTIHYKHLTTARGYTDGLRTIWLDPRCTTIEQRCSLTHELFHVVAGHCGRQPPRVEDEVRAQTARYLVPWPYLLRHWASQVSVEDIADELCVTVDVLMDRIRYAHPIEREELNRACRGPLAA